MQIKFQRSGGFAGAATNVAGTVQFDERGARVNGEATDYHRELAAPEAQQLRTAAGQGDLPAAKSALSSSQAIPDGYQYEITVITDDGKSHSLTLGQGGPEQIQKVAAGAAQLGAWVQDETGKIWSHRVNSRK